MKVLEIIDGYSFGGIAKLMLDISNNINDIDIEFLTATNINDKWKNLDINRKSLKGKIIYNHRLYKFLKKNKYDIIHINSAVFLYSFQVVLISRLAGIKNIIVHSHNYHEVSIIRKLLLKILNPLYRKLTKVHLSCSKIASKSLYTKDEDVIILKNGIDIDKYKYDDKKRNKLRKKLRIDNKIVYGHVGRFEKQKNHELLIDIFYELQKIKDSVLLLVGIGSLEDEIKAKVKELNIEDKVIFLEFREDIGDLLNATDIFIFPSLYEGLGISVIESQTSGLPTIVSSSIPKEANISDRFIQVNSFDKEEWVNKILCIKSEDRKNAYRDTLKSGYDIKKTANKLEKIYRDLR